MTVTSYAQVEAHFPFQETVADEWIAAAARQASREWLEPLLGEALHARLLAGWEAQALEGPALQAAGLAQEFLAYATAATYTLRHNVHVGSMGLQINSGQGRKAAFQWMGDDLRREGIWPGARAAADGLLRLLAAHPEVFPEWQADPLATAEEPGWFAGADAFLRCQPCKQGHWVFQKLLIYLRDTHNIGLEKYVPLSASGTLAGLLAAGDLETVAIAGPLLKGIARLAVARALEGEPGGFVLEGGHLVHHPAPGAGFVEKQRLLALAAAQRLAQEAHALLAEWKAQLDGLASPEAYTWHYHSPLYVPPPGSPIYDTNNPEAPRGFHSLLI